MSSVRMSIVVRRDLQMSPGLLSAQVLHIGMEFIRQKHASTDPNVFSDNKMYFEPIQLEWVWDPYVAVLGVDTPEELEYIQKRAKDEGLPVMVWRDVIPSKVLDGQVLKCVVGIAIGPADSDKLRLVTGTLPLY